MFALGDLVQPKMGGPKLKIIEIQENNIVAVLANDENSKQYSLKTEDVTLYREEGDFGVC